MSVTNVNKLKRCLAGGEGRKVEFKEARNALPRDLFETVCAFLNREGGTILLGVADDGTVTGVEPDAAERLITDIVNLIDAYDLLMGFVEKHLPDPFYMENARRVSLREKIFREIVSNLLVHREYVDATPATLIIYRDRVETRNAAIPHGHGPIRPGHFTPFSKNPTLSKFFMQMGRGEELGSGVLNVSKYLPFYTQGAKPRFVEGDLFTAIIPLPGGDGASIDVNGGRESEQKSKQKSKQKNSERLLAIMRQNSAVSTQDLTTHLALSRAGVQKIIRGLKESGRLRRIGPDKGGHWEVVDG